MLKNTFAFTAFGALREDQFAPYLRDGQPVCAVTDGDFRVMKKAVYDAANRKFDRLSIATQKIYADTLRKTEEREGLYDTLTSDEKNTYDDEIRASGITRNKHYAPAIRDRLIGGRRGNEAVWNVGGRPVIDSCMHDAAIITFSQGGNIYTAGRLQAAYRQADLQKGARLLERETRFEPEIIAAFMRSKLATEFRCTPRHA